MRPLFAITNPWFAAVILTLALTAWTIPVSASQFSHGTTSFTVEVARPGVVDVRPGPAKVNRVLVVEGQRVAAGEVVAEIDTSELDREMAALKVQVDATRRKLDALRLEAQSFGILLEQGLVPRQRVTELEDRVTELEGSAEELISKLAAAEKRLANAEVRAPVGGVVGTVMPLPAGASFSAADTMLRIVSDPAAIVLEGKLGAAEVANLAAAGEARVWLGAASFFSASSLKARLTWREAPEQSSKSSSNPASDGHETLAIRLEITGGSKALPAGVVLVPGQRVSVSLSDPRRTLGQQFLDPIRRNFRLPLNTMNWRS